MLTFVNDYVQSEKCSYSTRTPSVEGVIKLVAADRRSDEELATLRARKRGVPSELEQRIIDARETVDAELRVEIDYALADMRATPRRSFLAYIVAKELDARQIQATTNETQLTLFAL